MNLAPAKPISMSIVSLPANLPVVRATVGKLCEMLGFDTAAAAAVVLSVDEALANIIQHAYRGTKDGRIDLTLHATCQEGGPVLKVSLRDYGPSLAGGAVDAQPRSQQLYPGGLGVMIMNQCMDSIEYLPAEGGGTMLIMTKRLLPHNEDPNRMSYQTTTSPVQSVRRLGEATVVQVVGDVDLNRSAEFQRALLDVLADCPGKIVVDLSGVPYMDSSGVASLVKLLSRARRTGVSLYLVGLNDRVRSIFEITRLDSVFDIFATEQEALS